MRLGGGVQLSPVRFWRDCCSGDSAEEEEEEKWICGESCCEDDDDEEQTDDIIISIEICPSAADPSHRFSHFFHQLIYQSISNIFKFNSYSASNRKSNLRRWRMGDRRRPIERVGVG